MKKNKYHTVKTVSKSNRKITEIGTIDTPNTYLHPRSRSVAWYRHFNKSGGVEQVLWNQTSAHFGINSVWFSAMHRI